MSCAPPPLSLLSNAVRRPWIPYCRYSRQSTPAPNPIILCPTATARECNMNTKTTRSPNHVDAARRHTHARRFDHMLFVRGYKQTRCGNNGGCIEAHYHVALEVCGCKFVCAVATLHRFFWHRRGCLLHIGPELSSRGFDANWNNRNLNPDPTAISNWIWVRQNRNYLKKGLREVHRTNWATAPCCCQVRQKIPAHRT